MHEERNEPLSRKFNIDKENKEIINQLYFYSVGSSKLIGDISKGIYFYGAIGTGKTIMLKAACKIISTYTIKQIEFMLAKKYEKTIIDTEHQRQNKSIAAKDIFFYEKRPMFIDDLGKEETEISIFGQKQQPIIDLISLRYDAGSWTFATSNYQEETLAGKYGEVIMSRMHAMMNFIQVKKEGYKVDEYESKNRRI